MPPALANRRQLLGRILRVINKNICALCEFSERGIQLRVARLIVRCVNDSPRRSFNPVSEAALRMIQLPRRHSILADRYRLARRHFHELPLGAHRGHVHRKIRHRHLCFKDLLQAVAAQILRSETVKMECIVLRIKRHEKWDPLNMIPMIMRH